MPSFFLICSSRDSAYITLYPRKLDFKLPMTALLWVTLYYCFVDYVYFQTVNVSHYNCRTHIMAKIWRQNRNRFTKNVSCVACLFVLPLLLLAIVVYSKTNTPDSLTSTKELSKNTGSITKTFVLIILIMSDATKAATRKVLRETWLSTGNEKIKHFFVVGSKGLASEVLENISDENFAFHDMLILNSTSESYTSLTKKVLAGFQWIHSNYNFNFLLKCDDDSFVRISSLLQELEKQPQNLLYWGFFKGGSSVFQKGKWKESEWFLCDTYLPYALGGGYILSSDLIEYLAKSAPLLQQYKSEDVSVGVWLSPLKINRIHDVRFDTEFKSRGCFNDYLITHKQSANDMRIKHNNLFSTGKLCPSELRARYSYNYNWTVPPTKCCKNFDPSLP